MSEVNQFIRNLKFVMEDPRFDSQPKLGAASGVSPTHIGNILRRDKVPSLAVMSKLAQAVGLEVWQMLLPTDYLERGMQGDFQKLLTSYLAADQDGRQTILHVARAQALVGSNSQDT